MHASGWEAQDCKRLRISRLVYILDSVYMETLKGIFSVFLSKGDSESHLEEHGEMMSPFPATHSPFSVRESPILSITIRGRAFLWKEDASHVHRHWAWSRGLL